MAMPLTRLVAFWLISWCVNVYVCMHGIVVVVVVVLLSLRNEFPLLA